MEGPAASVRVCINPDKIIELTGEVGLHGRQVILLLGHAELRLLAIPSELGVRKVFGHGLVHALKVELVGLVDFRSCSVHFYWYYV